MIHISKKTEESLSLKYKAVLVLFPFFIPIQSINATKFLANGQKRKWKEYWFYISLGYLLWTVVIILFFRLFLFSTGIITNKCFDLFFPFFPDESPSAEPFSLNEASGGTRRNTVSSFHVHPSENNPARYIFYHLYES